MATLRHVPIPAWPRNWPPRFPTYELADLAQSNLQQALLSWKAKASASASSGLKTAMPPPRPTLLSFTPAPTFTLGRRQSTQPLTPADEAALRTPLISHGTSAQSSSFQPVIFQAPRGGLATYHGPGQIVLWPVLDLRSPLLARPLTVRDYACLLEKTTIATLKRLYGLDGFTTENPGVWVRRRNEGNSGDKNPGSEGVQGDDCKVAAMGVHLRRHVTGLGIAINCTTPVAGPAASNPWARIVPCGLGEKGVTSVEAELGFTPESGSGEGPQDIASAWAREFATRLGLQGGSGAAGAAGPVEECSWDTLKGELNLEPQLLGNTGYEEAQIV